MFSNIVVAEFLHVRYWCITFHCRYTLKQSDTSELKSQFISVQFTKRVH